MHQLHTQRIAGHLGRDKTLKAVKFRFFWPGMSTDVMNWCRECWDCAKGKPGPGAGKAPLQQSKVGAPFDRIGIDIVGHCPITAKNNEYIIVIQDYFTKWVEAFAVPNHTAQTVADKLVTELFCRFGIPKQIHSDQGREFCSELMAEVCKLLEIDKTRTTPYRPQSDGLVERQNRSLKKMLSNFVNENRNDWDDNLPFLLMAYRNSNHDSTGLSPHKMMMGREMTYPIDILAGSPPNTPKSSCPIEYVQWLKHVLDKSHCFARMSLDKAAQRQKQNYDRGVKARSFETNDFVWRWSPSVAGVKFGRGWIGPFVVLEKLSDVLYRIQKLPQTKPIVVHVDHLKLYYGETPLAWQIDDVSDDEISHVSHNEDVEMFETDVHNDSNDIDVNIESDINDNENDRGEILKTPPRRTRCGRPVNRPLKYSPD
ncbi:protein NYNRIN-like [Mytilus trossulus]|uniref:protein NYNRIN-like n=1 Tax=Mytilus trossulus TaxID=6551 RepID=UPI003007C2A4